MFLYYARLGKGLSPLIIPKALIDYFGKGIPVSDTIRNGKYIYDYVTFQKIGRQYDVIHNNEKIQHINRFYICKTSPYLYKSKETYKYDKKLNTSIKVKTMESVIAGQGVEIFNTYVEKPMEDYKINYQYYINEANKVIELLEPKQLTLF